jgi:hypothetical protein
LAFIVNLNPSALCARPVNSGVRQLALNVKLTDGLSLGQARLGVHSVEGFLLHLMADALSGILDTA